MLKSEKLQFKEVVALFASDKTREKKLLIYLKKNWLNFSKIRKKNFAHHIILGLIYTLSLVEPKWNVSIYKKILRSSYIFLNTTHKNTIYKKCKKWNTFCILISCTKFPSMKIHREREEEERYVPICLQIYTAFGGVITLHFLLRTLCCLLNWNSISVFVTISPK